MRTSAESAWNDVRTPPNRGAFRSRPGRWRVRGGSTTAAGWVFSPPASAALPPRTAYPMRWLALLFLLCSTAAVAAPEGSSRETSRKKPKAPPREAEPRASAGSAFAHRDPAGRDEARGGAAILPRARGWRVPRRWLQPRPPGLGAADPDAARLGPFSIDVELGWRLARFRADIPGTGVAVSALHSIPVTAVGRMNLVRMARPSAWTCAWAWGRSWRCTTCRATSPRLRAHGTRLGAAGGRPSCASRCRRSSLPRRAGRARRGVHPLRRRTVHGCAGAPGREVLSCHEKARLLTALRLAPGLPGLAGAGHPLGSRRRQMARARPRRSPSMPS